MESRAPTVLISDRRMHLVALACLLFGLALSFFAWYHAVAAKDLEVDRDFARFSARSDASIEDRARNHQFAIAGFRGLFAVADQVSSSEFHDQFVALRSGRWHPGLMAVQYIERAPAGGRASPLVVKYSEPALDGALAVGQAVTVQGDLATVLTVAAATGAEAATPPQHFDESTSGYAVYYAVYERGRKLATPQQRKDAVRGYVRGIFRTAGMFDDVLPQTQAEGYRVWIEDHSTPLSGGGSALLFDSDPSAPPTPAHQAETHEHSYSFVVGERTWMVHASRPRANHWFALWPMTVLMCGIALSCGGWLVLRILTAQYGRASHLARRMGREAQESAARLRNVIDHSADGIVTIDARARLLSVNPATQRMFGLPMSQLVGRPLADLIDEPVRAGVLDWLSETGVGDAADTREREEVAIRRDGTRFPLAMSFNAMGEIEPGMRVGILRDVSERRRTESKMQHMAHHDALTGLPNRILLMQRLEEAVASASKKQGQPKTLVGLMFIDLDRFKIINDSLGHAVGDQLLIAVARRLERAARTADTVARMGGDEFVVMLPRMVTAAEAEIVARKVLIALAEPVVVDGHELLVTASVGLASCPELAQDAATLLSRADAAMYASKRAGRNSWCWFKPDQAETTSNRLQLERDLLHALDRKELEVHFQPQFDAATGSLVGAEALLRWRHPELGMIPPADFIALAEDSGLIIPIGRWVLAESLQQARSWQQGRRTPLKVAVNLSPRQMDSDALLWMVGDLLAETGVDPRLLELEITESVLVRDIESAARRLRQLADLGVSIAIDDFGVGYSSLSYLRDLPIHSIKIDRSFIRPLPDDEGAALLVSALIAMAHQLRLRVVAEGVETEAQLSLLRKAGCETIQGFLLARPLTREAFAALVRRDAGIDIDTDSETDAKKRSGSHSRPASLFPA